MKQYKISKPINTFEFTDLAWWPLPFRLSLTRYLSWMNKKFGVSRVIASRLKPLINNNPSRTVIDLCSGSGGPWTSVLEAMQQEQYPNDLRVICTDKFPSVSASVVLGPFQQDFESQSVDAAEAIARYEGPFTIMNGFHHLSRAVIDELIHEAGQKGVALAIFEGTNPRLSDVLLSPLSAVLFLQYSVQNIRKLSLIQFVGTFIVPVIPLFVAWDTFSSHLRSYDSHDMKQLLMQGYDETEITSGTDKAGPIRVTWAIAQPRKG